MMATGLETNLTFYTVPVSELRDLSQLRTQKDAILLDGKKLENLTNKDLLDLSFVRLCQGTLPPQVKLAEV